MVTRLVGGAGLRVGMVGLEVVVGLVGSLVKGVLSPGYSQLPNGG